VAKNGEEIKRHSAPLIAAIFLLLPVLYVGSYLALVNPQGMMFVAESSAGHFSGPVYHYRIESRGPAVLFWPLERIDRKVRPGAWNNPEANLLRLGIRKALRANRRRGFGGTT
jgi:hypothetical protein